MSPVIIRRLERHDDRSVFHSGNDELDVFLQRYAGQHQFNKNYSATYVAIDSENAICGYVTLSMGELKRQETEAAFGPKVARLHHPVVRIARLATDEKCRGMGLGLQLLLHAFAVSAQVFSLVGGVGIVVDAKRNSVGFYQKHKFREFIPYVGPSEQRPEISAMFVPRWWLEGGAGSK